MALSSGNQVCTSGQGEERSGKSEYRSGQAEERSGEQGTLLFLSAHFTIKTPDKWNRLVF